MGQDGVQSGVSGELNKNVPATSRSGRSCALPQIRELLKDRQKKLRAVRCVSGDQGGRAREDARVRASGTTEQVALRVSGQRMNGLLVRVRLEHFW